MDDTNSVAWGDWDGDGDPDLAVGNDDEPNRVYENVGGGLNLTWSSPETDNTNSVAWGDWDNDDDLDLAVGNASNQPNRVYENVEGGLTLAWSSPETDYTYSVAWGDWDGDDDLDLAVGNWYESTRVYENVGNSLALARSLPESAYNYTRSVAWEDWDGGGDLDLAMAHTNSQPNKVYKNGEGNLSLTWSSPETDNTNSVAWGDWDGDGDLDLVVGNYGQPNRMYKNGEGGLSLTWSSSESDDTHSVAWGDWDGDGDLDLAVGNNELNNRVHINHSIDIPTLVDSATMAQITYPGGASAPFFASAKVLEEPSLPILFALLDSESNSARFIKTYYSLDGGSTWRPAVAASGTITTNLEASPTGTVHTYTWDIYNSGVFGASDSAVFRLDVYQGFTGPGPYMYPFRRVQTLPFRLRGSQVRVMSDTLPVANAVVYRQPAGQTGLYEPYYDNFGRPFRTNPAGYLQGWGEIAEGDKLVGLAPITATESYTLYYTNATPTPDGLEPYTVTAPGVQTLTVSADNPLLLFNLDVSLEWDARNDKEFLTQLEHDLQRASESLYDWTNGQAALGRVTVYHDREQWNDAYMRIYASNRLRPSAMKGGVASAVITDPLTTTLTYLPGQVRMGATWNRYGDPSGNLGEDWPRTLGHELGHFTLFLDDNYLGFDDDGFLIPVEDCPGAMSDPYREDYPYDEFHSDQSWLPACKQTLSHQLTGRSDWSTIAAFYPQLNSTVTNTGPSLLPLTVTKVGFVEPITPPVTLEVPIFNLTYKGSRVVPGSSARAFLFQGDRLTDEGRPTLDQVLARGARPGDRLCVYEPDANRLGCETVDPPDLQLDLFDVTGWQPEVVVTPITSRTVALTVTNLAPGLPLQARLYPVNYSAALTLTLIEAGGAYTSTLHLDRPVFEACVHLWVAEPEPRRETVTEYALGGNPGHMWSRNAPRGSPGHMWSRNAPVISADGQVILYGQGLEFEEGEFFALQAATHLPTAPPWTTVVGRAYRLTTTPNAPDLSRASVSFGYLGNEVPPGEEGWLRVYFWDGEEWQVLPTELDLYHNVASTPAQGPGLYALMSSLEILLYGPGWNNFAYPIEGTRPVTEALLSIGGYYTTVYGYQPEDTIDPWKVHDVTVPNWINELEVLEFGHGYWINVSEAITLYLKGSTGTPPRIEGSFPYPPATYYGPVQSSPYFTPTTGMTVTAWVDGHFCGQGVVTAPVGYGIAYVVDVMADDWGSYAGCGTPGRMVTFYIETQRMAPMVEWNNSRLWEVPLQPIASPEVEDDLATTAEDTPVTINVLANDEDPDGEPLAVHVVGSPLSGTAIISGIVAIVYTPTLDFHGSDTFTYTISDTYGLTDTAMVTIVVTPVNDPPQAVDDTAATLEDTPVTISVLTNDEDVDGDPLAVHVVGSPFSGTVTISDTATVVYTPTLDFHGTDAFTYTVSDSGGLTGTAMVTVTVGPVNDPPQALDDTAATLEDTPVIISVLANDSDPDSDPLAVQAVGTPLSGTVTISDAAMVIYTPTMDFYGSDAFTYTIGDPGGLTDTATVTIIVTTATDPPQAVDDTAASLEDTPVTVSVLANDSDPDGDPLTVQTVGAPLSGTAVISGTAVVVYAPDLNFHGTDAFTYIVGDIYGLTDTATVTVIISPVNDPPTISDVADQITRAGIPVGPLLFTIGDVETPDEDLTLSGRSSDPSLVPDDQIVFGGEGISRTVTIMPTAGMIGMITVTVTVYDGSSAASDTFALAIGPYQIYLPLIVRDVHAR